MWILTKPSDLDLQCFFKKDKSGFSMTGVKICKTVKFIGHGLALINEF